MPDQRLKTLFLGIGMRFGPDVAKAYVKMDDSYENAVSLVISELKTDPATLDTLFMAVQEYEEIMKMQEAMDDYST